MYIPCHHLNDVNILLDLSFPVQKPFVVVIWLKSKVQNFPRPSRPHATSPTSSSSAPSPPVSSFHPPKTSITQTTPFSSDLLLCLCLLGFCYCSFQAPIRWLLPEGSPNYSALPLSCLNYPLFWGHSHSTLWENESVISIHLSVVLASCWPGLCRLSILQSLAKLFTKLKLFPITLCFSMVYAKKQKFPTHFRKSHLLDQTWFCQEKTKVMVD